MLEIDTIIDVLANNAVVIVGSFVGAIFVGYVAYEGSRRNSAADAATKFRDALAGVILNLEHNPSLPSAQIANIDHDQILAAIQQFRRFVPWYRRCGFNKAAREYQHACAVASEGGSILAQFASEQGEYAQAKRRLLHGAVKTLMSYAKQT